MRVKHGRLNKAFQINYYTWNIAVNNRVKPSLDSKISDNENSRTDTYLTPTYGQTPFSVAIPTHTIPDLPMTPRAAQRLISDELDMDARNSADLGSYITDYMDPEIDIIINQTLGKVFIDKSEYPLTAEMGDRVARMIQSWYNGTPATTSSGFIGTPTIGSSEAVMLGLIAHRYAWIKSWKTRKNRTPEGYPSGYYRKDKPFLLAARDIHTCWNKYCLYYNTDSLLFNLSDNKYTLSAIDVSTFLNTTIKSLLTNPDVKPEYKALAEIIIEACDFDPVADEEILGLKTPAELVFVVGAVVGTTFTGSADPVSEINDVLVTLKTNTFAGTKDAIDIPIHVDAASGGFCLPFSMPYLSWDFRLPQVRSINVSNHKFGLVYPGVGTVVFKDEHVVDPSLIYNVTYLGAAFKDYTVNFSRGSAMVIAAYYNLIRFGIKGYQEIIENCLSNALHLDDLINNDIGTKHYFQTISQTNLFPIVVWIDRRESPLPWTLTDLSQELEKRGWKLPAYNLPYTNSETPDGPLAMRVVIRQDLSHDKISILHADIVKAIHFLNATVENLDIENPDVQRLLKKDSLHYTYKGARGC